MTEKSLMLKYKGALYLGYGTKTKAYWLCDLEKKKVIFRIIKKDDSQDVVFDETKNSIKEDDEPPKNEPGTKFVQLDCWSEDEIKTTVPTGRRI